MASWHMKKNFEKGVEGWRGIWKIVRTSGKILATPLLIKRKRMEIRNKMTPFLRKKEISFEKWNELSAQYPASRGLFSVVFAEMTGARKRDLCPGSKRTVLNMRHGHLATKPSREAMLLCGLTK